MTDISITIYDEVWKNDDVFIDELFTKYMKSNDL